MAVRIFLFTSLSHCKVQYWFDREGAVSWLHHPKALAQHQLRASCLCWSVRCNKDLFHCCQRLFGVCAANRWRAAGWRTKTSRHIFSSPLRMYAWGEGEYPGCFIHFRPCPPGNRETPHVFPLSKLRQPGLFVHLLPDGMQPLHREL